MDTNDFKKLIGSDCLVIDPRSKKKQFEPGTIKSVNYSVHGIGGEGDTYEVITYDVILKRVTVSKDRFREGLEYHRRVCVSGDRIQILS